MSRRQELILLRDCVACWPLAGAAGGLTSVAAWLTL